MCVLRVDLPHVLTPFGQTMEVRAISSGYQRQDVDDACFFLAQ